jgi:hypothetical protein
MYTGCQACQRSLVDEVAECAGGRCDACMPGHEVPGNGGLAAAERGRRKQAQLVAADLIEASAVAGHVCPVVWALVW